MFSMAVGRRIIHAIRSRRLSEKYVSVSVDAEMDYQSGRAGICEGTRKNSASKILRLSPRPEPSPTIENDLLGTLRNFGVASSPPSFSSEPTAAQHRNDAKG